MTIDTLLEYKIDNIAINKACAKYLGVTITQNLSWKGRITKISNKANSSCGFLQHNITNNSAPSMSSLLLMLHM